jgi:glucokinase
MRAANLPFKEYPLAKRFSDLLQVPAVLINDADAAIAAEVWGKDTSSRYLSNSNIAMITIGTGIGMGLILNKRLFRGSNGLIEGGHTILHPSSEQVCSCGQRGCVELTASARNTTTRYNARIASSSGALNPAKGAKEVFERAASGDEIAVAVLEEVMLHPLLDYD